MYPEIYTYYYFCHVGNVVKQAMIDFLTINIDTITIKMHCLTMYIDDSVH